MKELTWKSKILMMLFVAVFVSGILVGMKGADLCIHDNAAYTILQPEIFVPEEIDTVLYDENLNQLYVCYNDASCVNVYSEEGCFLWAVSTPYLRSSYFALRNDQLLIYGLFDAYVYRAADGVFIKKDTVENLELSYEWEKEAVEKVEAGSFYFDTYQLYHAEEDGSLTTILARPWWYWLFNVSFFGILSLCGGIGIFTILFMEHRKRNRAMREALHPFRYSVELSDPRATPFLKYFRATVVVHLVYIVLNLILGFLFEGLITILIIPLLVHLVISFIVLNIKLAAIPMTEKEEEIVGYWETRMGISFLLAFLSVFVVGMFA